VERGVDPYEVLIEQAAGVPAGSEGLYWLPYLMGERTPHLDAAARGGWVGLTARHTRAHLLRALIEGVSYSLKDCLEIIESLGSQVSVVRASGGGARSLFWRQILAAVLERPIATLQTQEGSAYGAALLAMAGTGHYGSVVEACHAAIHERQRMEPDSGMAAAYRRGYPIFQALYPALKDTFREIDLAG
jgi:xylulokinase